MLSFGRRRALTLVFLTLVLACWTMAAEQTLGEESREGPKPSLLEGVKAPDGFRVTLFAAPPDISYPAAVKVTPEGMVFVSVDKNSSLDRQKGRGKIVRAIDLDADGRADSFTDFVPSIESPRGLEFDGEFLYVLHQPTLSAYRDLDGDGVAEEHRVLVQGIGFDLGGRPADHTSNGVRMGIDGWLYLAIGDFGFREAVGSDGTRLQLHGGGVVRVRPDGSELEQWSRGTRNIYGVAVDPWLDLFARDNTNDGGGWDVRLHHCVALAEHGYPSLYKNYAEETLAPLADYGPGSGTSACFVDEPTLPLPFGRTLFTCDWGRNRVYRHPLARQGASFRAGQEVFASIPRPTDLGVDASGTITIAGWRGGKYRYDGDEVGLLVQLRPKSGPAADPVPRVGELTRGQLLARLASDSAIWRLAAQREILRRPRDVVLNRALEVLAKSHASSRVRVAALFTLKQVSGVESHAFLAGLTADPTVREFALRALADRRTETGGVPVEPFLAGLRDDRARVRLQSLIGLTRLGVREAAPQMLELTRSADRTLSHTAVRALRVLAPVEACVAAIDGEDAELSLGALRVLRYLHDERVVSGLIERLDRLEDAAARRGLLLVLVRLYYREAPWDGSSWGTRPDTTGPYYRRVEWEESARIGERLWRELASSDLQTTTFLLDWMERHRLRLTDAPERLAAIAGRGEAFSDFVQTLLERPSVSSDHLGDLIGCDDASLREMAKSVLEARAAKAETRKQKKPGKKRRARGPLVRKFDRREVIERVEKIPGDPEAGQRLFVELECARCHTVSPDEPLRGPFLGGIRERYGRAELATSILDPSAQVAQGFTANFFVMRDGVYREGFVVREAADEVEYRDTKGEAVLLRKADILRRGESKGSIMPAGLVDRIGLQDFASLLAYLESLPARTVVGD